MALYRWFPWLVRAGWIPLPFTAGPTLEAALRQHSSPVALAGGIGLWTAWAVGLVALFVPHVRNYYLDEFADQLVALLSDWIRWLAARSATPVELAERCLPYAEGQPHPQLMTDNNIEPEYFARVTE